jgi:glycosyltransferase involved in cell wall biosynthesis
MTKALLLDLTRSLRRAGRMATGVDRVEQAYLSHFIQSVVPVFGVVRTPFGFVLLDRAGMQAFEAKLRGEVPWGGVSLLSRLAKGRSAIVKSAESDVRALGAARCMRGRLADMLRGRLEGGFEYYNVGHSNLTDRMLGGVKSAGGRIHALIHDVIPLEYPQYQRPQTVEPFRDKLARVSAQADRVIFNSRDTQRRTEMYLAEMGRVPDGIVAHLGTMSIAVEDVELPPEIPKGVPYFVTVGTIEPRKNHGFLLDLWAQLGPSAPLLVICGARGWENHAVFDRLDALDPAGNVQELNDLPDTTLSKVVSGAAGALIPSFAEGYGLPPIEALSLGTRVLCNNLAVFHEIVGENADYAPVNEPEMWISKIKEWEKSQPGAQGRTQFEGPQWRDHFKTVLSLT